MTHNLTPLATMQSKTDRVFEAIRASILSLRLSPGQPISEKVLAEQFGVSKSPVREALKRLEREGLVDIVPQSGTYVSHLRESAVRSASQVRQILECGAARLACAKDRPRLGNELIQICSDMEAISEISKLDEFLVLDRKFHRTILGTIDNEFIAGICEEMEAHIQRLRRWSFIKTEGRMAQVTEEHRNIAIAFQKGDPERVESLMSRHLGRSESLIRLLQANPNFFRE